MDRLVASSILYVPQRMASSCSHASAWLPFASPATFLASASPELPASSRLVSATTAPPSTLIATIHRFDHMLDLVHHSSQSLLRSRSETCWQRSWPRLSISVKMFFGRKSWSVLVGIHRACKVSTWLQKPKIWGGGIYHWCTGIVLHMRVVGACKDCSSYNSPHYYN
jgi:hypothetical protein